MPAGEIQPPEHLGGRIRRQGKSQGREIGQRPKGVVRGESFFQKGANLGEIQTFGPGGVDGLENAQFRRTLQDRSGADLLEDFVQFVADAVTGDCIEGPIVQGGAEEIFGLCLQPEPQPLFVPNGPEDTGGVVGEAGGVEDPDLAVFQVLEAVMLVKDPGIGVEEGEGQGID